jgi:hypothetical protein
MQEKHKVTLYIPPDLHRQLKIRAAVGAEPMSAIAQRAIVFYLSHSEVVDEVEAAHGRAHQVYSCPECESPLVLRESEMVRLGSQSGLLVDESLSISKVKSGQSSSDFQGEQELVPV